MTDEEYMRIAISEAKQALPFGDVPVGAILVQGHQIVAKFHNEKELHQMATAHAEVLCIECACQKFGKWRLSDCTLYVTMEPCPMCAGALWNARIGRIVIGTKDATAGACGSVWSLETSPIHWNPEITYGICEEECKCLLQAFFQQRRSEKKSNM